DLAHAVRQAGHLKVPMMLEIKEVDDLFRLLPCAQFRAARSLCKKQFAPEARAAVRVITDQQVLQYGGVFEQLDVLEGTRDTPGRNVMGRHVCQPLAIEHDMA